MMKRLLFLFLITSTALNLHAQEQESLLPSPNIEPKEDKQSAHDGYKGRGAIALHLGAIGGGLEYAENLTRHINLRGRLTYFSLNDQEFTVEFSGEELTGNFGGDIIIADLLFEYLPFEGAALKLVGGASYLFNYNAGLTANFNDNLSYGDVVLEPEDIGVLGLDVDWAGFAPYAGIGWGRAVPKKRFGFGIELGTHYANAPKIDLTATGAISGTAENEDQLEEDMSEYRWLPFVQFRFAYKL